MREQRPPKRLVVGMVAPLLAGPGPTESAPRRNRNPIPKPWEGRIVGLLHVFEGQAVQPRHDVDLLAVALNPLFIQRVRADR